MAEPVDSSADFLVTRGCGRTISLKAYDPEANTVGTGSNYFGSRGAKRIIVDAETVTITATWKIAGLTSRPPVRSQIVDGSETWIVTPRQSSDPIGGVYSFDCVLA